MQRLNSLFVADDSPCFLVSIAWKLRIVYDSIMFLLLKMGRSRQLLSE